MRLKDFFTPDAVGLALKGRTKDEVLAELVQLLALDGRASETLLRVLHRRELLGSTGIGRGLAIPHSRSLVVNRLRPRSAAATMVSNTARWTTVRCTISFLS
jgi:PTS system nitrogen regulatory IIA component